MGKWIINLHMKQFTAIVHWGQPAEGGFWATCLEVPGANGQGETKEKCLGYLKEAIRLLLDTECAEVFGLDPQAETAELVRHETMAAARPSSGTRLHAGPRRRQQFHLEQPADWPQGSDSTAQRNQKVSGAFHLPQPVRAGSARRSKAA
jgi:predicted RNase H-like HicB family nuclease